MAKKLASFYEGVAASGIDPTGAAAFDAAICRATESDIAEVLAEFECPGGIRGRE